MSHPACITSENLSFAYGSRWLFKDLQLSLPSSAVTCIMGASGCGKSTLLSLMNGLLKPDHGKIHRGSERIGMVFQEANLLPWLTAQENILLPLKLQPQAGARPSVYFNHLTETLGITAILQQYPRQLSGGQKMRVALARALIKEPDILFLDEPFSALDELTREQLQDFLLQLSQQRNISIVFVTHSVAEAAFLADNILVMRPGRNLWITPQRKDAPPRDNFRIQPSYLQLQIQIRKALYEVD